jgi:hypothetical protein
MMTDLEQVKELIGEENYNLLLLHGYFPIEIDAFKNMIHRYKNNELSSIH